MEHRDVHAKIRYLLLSLVIVLAISFAWREGISSWLYGRCFSNTMLAAHDLSRDFQQYAGSHGGRLPSSNQWENALRSQNTAPGEISTDIYFADTMFWERPRRFCMNQALSLARLDSLQNPDKTILFYESTVSMRSAADNLTSFPPCEARNGHVVAVGFADGHVEELPCRERAIAVTRSLSYTKAAQQH